jgi:outer membrane autotransporter protein
MITRRTLKPSFSLLALPLATFSALFLLAAPSSIFAQKNWVGPNPDNDWFTAANWSPTGAPALTDDAIIGNGTQATIAMPGATAQVVDLGGLTPGTLNVNGTGELTAGGNVFVGSTDNGTLNITGGGTVRHPGFDGIIGNASGVMGVATVDGAMSNWLLRNLVVGNFGHGTLNILNGGTVTGFDAFIGQQNASTGLAVVNGAGGASTLQLGGNFFVGGDGTGPHGTGVLRVLNGGIVNSNRLVVLSTGTLEIGANPMITVTNPSGIEYDGGTLKTIADTTLTNNGSLQTGGVILDSNGFTSTLSGTYTGSGGITKIGTGTIILSGGFSPYGGVTHVDGGVLQIDGSTVSSTTVDPGGTLAGSGLINASASNNGIVSPGSPGAGPGTLTIVGTYDQTNSATLRIDIGGLAPSQHDLLAVNSSVTLAGTLQLVRLNNFTPVNGDQVIIMTHSAINNSGQFFPVTDNFPGLIRPQVFYDTSDVRVVFALLNSFSSQALTPNQKSVAHNIDSAVNDPAAAALIGFLGNELPGNLPHDYDLIAPEELASIYEIGFSQAVVQNNNLQRRMDDIRAGSNGFCADGFVPQVSGKDYTKDSDGKGSLPDKSTRDVYTPAPDNRWGVFVTGTGDFVNVGNDDSNAPGYDITTGDVTVGADYRLCNNFAIGIDAGYSRSTADLVDDGRVDVDGGKVGAYATMFGKGLFGSKFYVDGAVGGGFNSYDTRRTGLQDEPVRGSTNGNEFNAMISYGSDWTFGCFNIGTWSSVQYTNVSIDQFTETGSLAPLIIEDQDENSFRATTGLHASYDIKAGHFIFRPEVRAAYQHEYCDQAYQVDSQLASGAGTVFRVRGPDIGRDAALVGAGMSMQWNNRLSTYVYYDGVLGRNNYDNNAVSGGFRIGF